MAPTLGQMIAAIGSPAEWGAIAAADLAWNNTAKSLTVAGDIKTVGWVAYSPTFSGFNPATPGDWASTYYKRLGNIVFLHFNFYGTSNSDVCAMTLPVNALTLDLFFNAIGFWNNSTASTTPGMVKITSADVSRAYFHVNWNVGGWTTSNKKGAFGQIWYMV